ncbi:MAG: fatty acid--CoA ligase family protein [Burkholderiales bacterium]
MKHTLLGARLCELARQSASATAWIDAGGEVGHEQAQALAGAFARWYRAQRRATDETVALSIADERRHLVASVALLALGVPQVTLPTNEPRPMREELVRRLGVRYLLADQPGYELPGCQTIVVPMAAYAPGAAGSAPIEAERADADTPAIYLSSSGTTGRAKILAYTQRAIAARAAAIGAVEGFGPGERIVVPASVQTFAGKTTRLYALLEGAASVLHDPRATDDTIVSSFIRHRASILHLTVLQATGLAAAPGTAPSLPAHARVFVGATRLPAGLRVAFEQRVGGRIFDRYGATEVGLIATTCPRGDEGVPDAVGRLLGDAQLEVVDADGEPLPAGRIGEFRLRTPWMTTGYVDDPVATSQRYRDGWFCPGDFGAITPEGVVRFLGRTDDMMSLAGIKIYPVEIERVLDTHPAVRAAAAFPARSPLFGEIPFAAVELHEDSGADAPSLLAYARERLGERAPRRILVLDALPRNSAGKIVKSALAARFEPDVGDP